MLTVGAVPVPPPPIAGVQLQRSSPDRRMHVLGIQRRHVLPASSAALCQPLRPRGMLLSGMNSDSDLLHR
jgi:hypothetical protein